LKSMKVNEYEAGIHKVSYEKVTTKSKLGQGSLSERKGLVPLTSLTIFLGSVVFLLKILLILFTKQATLMRRSTVLSLSLLLVFPR
jgi:hypothetical protein